ncbi:S-adenosyl-L-methionine-dependent methyltransferase [Xylariales sp. PMI_506]|nr:S-adenosyl-L-methionine-dependent methyltransferase [Xylariales sp. PMI_506]
MSDDILGFKLGRHVLQIDPDIIKDRGEGVTDIYYFEDNGRTYHGWMAGEYSLPNDVEEQARQDFQHIIYKELRDGELGAAPVENPEHVLDIGTGTGIWATEFAENNPNSHVVGTDLSLIQPAPATPNCEFLLQNAETEEWTFPYRFDYVHLRSMGPCFADMATTLRRSYNHMSAGGWIELQDSDWTSYECPDGSDEGASVERWMSTLVKGGAAAGRDMTKVRSYRKLLAQAGFVDIIEEPHPVAGSPWMRDPQQKRIAAMMGTALHAAVDAYRPFYAFAGLSPGEVDELVTSVKRDLKRIDIHWVGRAYFVYGRKPYAGET